MQIDYDYLKQLLEAMTAAERPWTDIEELKARVQAATAIFQGRNSSAQVRTGYSRVRAG